MISFLKSIFYWTPLEQNLLATDADSTLVSRYSAFAEFPLGPKQKPTTLRTVVIPNKGLEKIPHKLPLVLFIHGLGGQLGQFEHLIDYFAYFASVVTVDLPGHGKSDLVHDWDRTTTKAFVDMYKSVLASPDLPEHDGVFIVGHSMGSVIALELASALGDACVGVAAISPAIFGDDHANEKLRSMQKWLPWVPPALFDVFRAHQRGGGIESPSVKNFVSESTTDDKIREKQLRVNLQVNTKAWLRTAAGFDPYTRAKALQIKVPVIVIAAADDTVVKPEMARQLSAWLKEGSSPCTEYFEVHQAGHALLLERPEALNGLLGDFIAAHVNEKLSLAWQLSYRAQAGDKWSLKNEAKWRKTLAVGQIVVPSHLRGLKTLRQEDPEHSPKLLEEKHPDIIAIIDISREHPPYEPESFTRIKYHKFPTVSKVPPSRDEVKKFIELVDSIPVEAGQTVGIHCHYGFNRTGFLIASYLIERKNLSVKSAIEAFQTSRPSGIHHPHFIDELHVRYNL